MISEYLFKDSDVNMVCVKEATALLEISKHI